MKKPFLQQCTVLVIILFTTVSCGSKKIDSNKLYQQIKENQNEVLQTYSDAVNKTSIVSIALDNVLKDRITSADPIIKRTDYLANFKIYKFSALENKRYNIVVKSYCDCGGFTKQIMEPEITILNSEGEKLAEMEIVPKLPTFLEPIMFLGIDEIQSPQNQTIYILVSSKNTDIGQKAIVFVDEKSGEEIRHTMQLSKHPIGEISVKVSEIP